MTLRIAHCHDCGWHSTAAILLLPGRCPICRSVFVAWTPNPLLKEPA